MKRIFLFAALTLVASLSLITTQVLASPLNVVSAKGHPTGTPGPQHTPGVPPVTPGAQATEHANTNGRPQVFHGTISAVDSSSLTLTLTDGSSKTFSLNNQTRINIPGPNGSGAALQVGMRAVVMAFTDQNNNLVARAVMAIPGQPLRVHRVGWVTAYTAGSSITIRAMDGSTSTLALTGNTKILPANSANQLAVGSFVTIIAPRVPSAMGWTAIGIVVHPTNAGQGSRTPTATPTP